VGKHIVGNWKMHGSTAMVESLVRAITAGVPERAFQNGGRVTLCPPFPYLAVVSRLLARTRIQLGAQNTYPAASGAFTGEVAPTMLKDCGAAWCIVGHSERRQHFGESDAFIRRKVEALIAEGIRPILCVGETLPDREAERQERVVGRQIDAVLEGLPEVCARQLTFAYEPVWAIGTGHTATPEQARAMHGFIRERLSARLAEGIGRATALLYGGSVTPGNARELMVQPDVDGVLVGGASLKSDQFLAIIEQALP
jgi:triosephosphate isomerase